MQKKPQAFQISGTNRPSAPTGRSSFWFTPLVALVIAPTMSHAQLVFSDSFDDTVGNSVTNPAARATGALSGNMRYEFPNNSSGEVVVAGGKLDWTGATDSNGDLISSNSVQSFRFDNPSGVPKNWASYLAGTTYEIRYAYHSAATQGLAFGLSDTAHSGAGGATTNGSYDYAFKSKGAVWQSGEDGSSQDHGTSAGNTTYEVLISVNEMRGSAEAFVDDQLVAFRNIDFEGPKRYLSFGDPAGYGGHLESFSVEVIDFSKTASTNGDWSDPTTWTPSGVPDGRDSVVIPSGVTVQLDDADARAATVTVNGTLNVADDPATPDIKLTTRWVMVSGNSALLQCGTETTEFTQDFTLTLTGQEMTENVMGVGSKFLSAMEGGTINLQGTSQHSWTPLKATAEVGETTLSVVNNVKWRIGDQIVISQSSQINSKNSPVFESEVRTIVSKPNLKTLVLDSGLNYRHCGEAKKTYTSGSKSWTLNQRAHIGLLSHNITIQGDADSATTGFGGHIMIMGHGNSGTATISNVELHLMGQKSMLGRYPMHWHMVTDSGAGQ